MLVLEELDQPVLSHAHGPAGVAPDLADLVGFRVRGRKDKDTLEVYTDDPLNGRFALWHRDCRPAFWGGATHLLESTDPGARVLGTIEEADLQLLMDQLEEEDEGDTDYYVSPMTIDWLEQNGASPALVALLKKAVGDSEGVDVVWQES